jgi:hypothetical protein
MNSIQLSIMQRKNENFQVDCAGVLLEKTAFLICVLRLNRHNTLSQNSRAQGRDSEQHVCDVKSTYPLVTRTL